MSDRALFVAGLLALYAFVFILGGLVAAIRGAGA